jgi:uncharacterized protein (DUF433 family)
MNPHERIQIDPAICHGKPVIRDTRVPVSIIIGSLAGGMRMDEILVEYDVTIADIQAALSFANDLIAQESFHPLPRVA